MGPLGDSPVDGISNPHSSLKLSASQERVSLWMSLEDPKKTRYPKGPDLIKYFDLWGIAWPCHEDLEAPVRNGWCA